MQKESIINAKVISIYSGCLQIELPDKSIGNVMREEIFIKAANPIMLDAIAYWHPESIILGQTIPVVKFQDKENQYSRKAAVLIRVKNIKEEEIVAATITEIELSHVFAITDYGFFVRISYLELKNLLKSKYKSPRLDINGEKENKWIYLRDRVKVKIQHEINDSFMSAKFIISGKGEDSIIIEKPAVLSDPPKAPISIFDKVLILDNRVKTAHLIDSFFSEAGYITEILETQNKFNSWIEKLESEGQDDLIRQTYLAVILANNDWFGWEEICEKLVKNVTRFQVILVLSQSSNVGSTKEIEEKIRYRKEYFHIIGVWDDFFPLEALGSLISGQTAISEEFSSKDDLLSKHIFREGLSYKGLREDCESFLNTLVNAVSEKAKPCTGIMFQIHRKSHTVTIIAASGEKKIIAGFKKYKKHLHKSPLKDLAIHGQNSDINDARKNMGRYIYFLDSIGGIDKELSVKGIRLTPPSNTSFAYAFFLFSRKLNAFDNLNSRVDNTLKLVKRALEMSLLCRSMDEWTNRLSHVAEKANDFKFWAHESTACLFTPKNILKNVTEDQGLYGEQLKKVKIGFLRAWAVMTQLLSGIKIKDNIIDPENYIKNLFKICDDLYKCKNISKSINCNLEECILITGKSIAFECIMRNLIINAVQQIIEYCNGEGKIRVDVNVEKKTTGRSLLIVRVIDNGPGIHAKHWDSIFRSGVSTRETGTGLGLAVSRKMVEKTKGKLELIDSYIFNGAIFRLSFPVSIERTKE
jgi:signal transduction histidine kinase